MLGQDAYPTSDPNGQHEQDAQQQQSGLGAASPTDVDLNQKEANHKDESYIKPDPNDVERNQSAVSVDSDAGFDDGDPEEAWNSRWSFILAAIGSAIGLGNFWRFPFQAYAYGGGTFFIPYLIALFIVGIPLMQLEMAMGQVFRRAVTQSFGRLHPRFRGIGLAAGMVSFGVVCYYNAILAWGNVMFVKSFYSEMPWDVSNVEGTEVLSKPVDHFVNKVLMFPPSDDHFPRVIPAGLYAGAVFMWASIWLILIKGQDFISKAVWVTVLAPVVMLFVLIIQGATLPGAKEGVKAYIGRWDLSQLSDGNMWVDAFGQIFFSLGTGFGVMPAYASLNPRNSNIIKDAFIVSACNCLFSFLAGFAVFTIIGFFSHETGISIDDLRDEGVLAGGSLAFITYPAGLSMLSGAGGNAMCVIFFIVFYFLGLDSAFSLVEAAVLNMREVAVFARYSRAVLTSAVCAVGFVLTGPYLLDVGSAIVDVVDAYLASLGLLFVGFLECLVAGWVYKKHDSYHQTGTLAGIIFDVGSWVGFFFFTVLSLTLADTGMESGPVIGTSIGVGLIIILGSWVTALLLAKSKLGNANDAAYYLFLHGPDCLKNTINGVITDGAPNNWTINRIWIINLKFVMTPLLFFLLVLRCDTYAESGGPYSSSYPYTYLQVLGLLSFVVVFILFAVGFFFPELYADPKLKVASGKGSTSTN